MMTVIKGIIINPRGGCSAEMFRSGALAFSDNGKIVFMGNSDDYSFNENDKIIDYSDCIIIPGLIDLHTHLPQFTATGLGKGTLLDWLNTYIFPLEAKFNDEKFAKYHSDLFFEELLSRGTTYAVVYSAGFKIAACEAFKAASRSGIRAMIGNPLMDMNVPECFITSIEKMLGDTNELCNCWHGADSGRLKYIVTPRFAGSCSFELMRRFAEFAKKEDLFIQTHLSENKKELSWITGLFPEYDSYTDVYAKAGLLANKTILAHCIHLSEKEIDVLKNTGSIIAHCAVSNRFLASGIMPLADYRDNDMIIGLGTDVAGGYSCSMLHTAMESVENSKLLDCLTDGEGSKVIEPTEAFNLATIEAARAIGEDHNIGSLDIEKSADFAVFSVKEIKHEISDNFNAGEMIAKLMYRLCLNKTQATYIRGKKVFGG